MLRSSSSPAGAFGGRCLLVGQCWMVMGEARSTSVVGLWRTGDSDPFSWLGCWTAPGWRRVMVGELTYELSSSAGASSWIVW